MTTHKKQPTKRGRRKKRKRLRRLIIAYLMRAIVILIGITMIILMVCGCLYIYDKFAVPDKYTKPNNEIDIYASDDKASTSAENSTPEFCVVIDAGHGGSDGGTVGGDIIEKDINLSVALKLNEILANNNIEVILTRSTDEDMSLAQRISVANASNADFFISLHCNYYEDDAQIAGLECYYSSPDATESKMYAESIIDAVSLSDDIKVRDAKSENYYVLRNTQMPAVLVEMGFLSNYSECQKLLNNDYQETLSQKIAEGILQELDNSKEVSVN